MVDKKGFIFFAVLLVSIGSCSKPVQQVSLKDEALKTMMVMIDALLERQIHNPSDPDFGAVQCHSCDVLHTRAAESMNLATDYLAEVMSPNFASINYCVTTTATLVMMNHYFPNEKWGIKSRELART